MRDVRTTRAACGEICVSRARERAVLGSFPKRKPARRATRNANSHAHIWIRINSTSSTTYQQFSAKPLKINEALVSFSAVAHPIRKRSRATVPGVVCGVSGQVTE
jgi:hypothetical protein